MTCIWALKFKTPYKRSFDGHFNFLHASMMVSHVRQYAMVPLLACVHHRSIAFAILRRLNHSRVIYWLAIIQKKRFPSGAIQMPAFTLICRSRVEATTATPSISYANFRFEIFQRMQMTYEIRARLCTAIGRQIALTYIAVCATTIKW